MQEAVSSASKTPAQIFTKILQTKIATVKGLEYIPNKPVVYLV